MPRKFSITSRLILSSLMFGLFCKSGIAQSAGTVTFKNFRHYPEGQWLIESSGSSNGASAGPPHTETACISFRDPGAIGAAMKLGNSVAAGCTAKVINDQERLAEYEQQCPLGNGTLQTSHVTMRAVDDRTMTTDWRYTIPGMVETVAHTKSTYQGPCTAATKAAQAAASKLSPEDCASLPEMRSGFENSGNICGQLPEANRAQCQARIEMSRNTLAMMEQQCK